MEAAKIEAQRPPDSTELKHEERMSIVDKEKFGLVKSINDQEIAIQQLESSIANMKNQLKRLQEENAALQNPEIDVYAYFFLIF